jgi:hypothetical protein
VGSVGRRWSGIDALIYEYVAELYSGTLVIVVAYSRLIDTDMLSGRADFVAVTVCVRITVCDIVIVVRRDSVEDLEGVVLSEDGEVFFWKRFARR